MEDTLKLLVVDDSRIMRDAIAKMFAGDAGIEIVGEAANGVEALEAIRMYSPDVITLDVAMPDMDGITALKHIMIKNPHPTVMLSSLTLEGARVAFDALRYGAVDFIAKPSALQDTDLGEQEAEIRSKIEYAAAVTVDAIKYIRETPSNMGHVPEYAMPRPQKVVALGSAEGGYGALLKIIPHLDVDVPYSYLATMYAAREHVDAFASYLNHFSNVHVKRAAHDEVLRPGVCYLSSGMDYMTLHHQDDGYSLHVSPAPFASRKGAIDMLLFSTAEVMADKSVGVILSGRGHDGAEGLEEIMHRGGESIIQDPKSCLCKEMVQFALEKSKASPVVTDNRIASVINKMM
jgi:two-component system chemotaxis response regulator CheB